MLENGSGGLDGSGHVSRGDRRLWTEMQEVQVAKARPSGGLEQQRQGLEMPFKDSTAAAELGEALWSNQREAFVR